MGAAEKIRTISVMDYLEGEKVSRVKQEYLDGEVYAMAGSSVRHNRIAGNIFNRLDQHLGDGPCEAFMSDIKLRVTPTKFYYPDVLVACEEPDTDPYYRTDPRLVVEVTSPSTEQIDRDEKLSAYKNIKSLKEYVIVSQTTVRVEVYRRKRGESWEYEELTDLANELHLKSINLSLPLAQIYRRVKTPTPKSRPRVVE